MLNLTRTFSAALLVVGVALCAGCFSAQKLSTHAGRVRVEFRDPGNGAGWPAEYARVETAVKKWAAEQGMREVPANAPETHMRYQGKGDTPTLRQVHFTGGGPAAQQWPIEAMLIFDPAAGVPWTDVTLLEGYGKEPSERLQALFKSLSEALRGEFGARVSGRLW